MSKLRKWPKDPKKPVSFSDLIGPLKKALLFGYELKRRNKGRSVPYDGYDIGDDEKVTSFSPNVRLRAGNLKHDLEDQGRDLLDIILGLAVQLGIEQGRRVLRSSTTKDLVQLQLDWKLDEIRDKKLQKEIRELIRDLLGEKRVSPKVRYKKIQKIMKSLKDK